MTPGGTGGLGGLQGDSLEIAAVFEAGPEAEFGLRMLASPGGEEQTRLVYSGAEQRLRLEAEDSSLSPAVDRSPRQAPVSLAGGHELRLRVFVDRSIVEVFANESVCLAGRVYPTRPDSLGLDLFARRGQVRLKSMTVWPLGSIWG